MNASNINASSVLETLHPATVKALEGLFLKRFVSAMSATIGSAPAVSGPDTDVVTPKKRGPKPKAATVEAPGKRGPGRPKKTVDADGKKITASQVIREFDAENPDAKANDVVAHCHSLGFKKVVPANVYNVRQNLKKAADAEATAKAERKAARAAKASKKVSKKASKKASKK
jgi:hypothetical protein